MRKIILPGIFGPIVSQPLLLLKELCRSYGVTFIVASMIVFTSVQETYAQGPYCNTLNCTANDVGNPSYFIGDVNGVPLTAVTCIPGNPVTVYLWITFTVTANNRYEINVVGDIFLDGAFGSAFSYCIGDLNSGTYTRNI